MCAHPYLVVLNELIDGIETDVVNEVILGTATFGFGVDTTMIVFAISTERRERERERERERKRSVK